MGLNVVLNLEQDEYMKNGLTASAGARFISCIYLQYWGKMYLFPRVTVHDKVTRALCDEFGLDVQPSTANQ